MAVVRIDDTLLKMLKGELKKEENKYKYGSISLLINSIIHEKLNSKEEKSRRGKR